jgi:hypothetical protein
MMRLVVSLVILAATAFAETGPFQWRGSVAAGRVVEVLSINGDVVAEGYDGAEVEVVANVSSDAGATATPVAVKAVEHENGVTVCATYQGPDPARQGQCVNADNPQQAKAGGARVNFTVRVPRGVGLIGRTVNGLVDAQKLQSDVEAYTVNGKINIQTTGSAQARTINGSISASLGNPFWRKDREFSTVNGSITLNLPATTNTDVNAETVNGRVTTAFRVRSGCPTEKQVKGAIGTGGSSLKLKTVNGSIQLKKTS